MYVRRHLLCMRERTLNVSATMTVCNITLREDICNGHQNSGYTRLWLWWFDKKARLSTTTHTTGACASDKPFLYEYRIAQFPGHVTPNQDDIKNLSGKTSILSCLEYHNSPLVL